MCWVLAYSEPEGTHGSPAGYSLIDCDPEGTQNSLLTCPAFLSAKVVDLDPCLSKKPLEEKPSQPYSARESLSEVQSLSSFQSESCDDNGECRVLCCGHLEMLFVFVVLCSDVGGPGSLINDENAPCFPWRKCVLRYECLHEPVPGKILKGSSVIGCLPSIDRGLGSVPSIAKHSSVLTEMLF